MDPDLSNMRMQSNSLRMEEPTASTQTKWGEFKPKLSCPTLLFWPLASGSPILPFFSNHSTQKLFQQPWPHHDPSFIYNIICIISFIIWLQSNPNSGGSHQSFELSSSSSSSSSSTSSIYFSTFIYSCKNNPQQLNQSSLHHHHHHARTCSKLRRSGNPLVIGGCLSRHSVWVCWVVASTLEPSLS